MGRKIFLAIVFSSLVSFSSFAQESVSGLKPLDSHRLYFGGNIGGGFANRQLGINIAPELGYKITDRWSAGVGGSYAFIRDYDFKQNYYSYGAKVFSRYFILNNLFVQGENGFDNYEALVSNGHTYIDQRINIPFLRLGGGYRQRLGENTSIVLVILYDFDYSIYTPYANPYIGGGIVFGL